MIKLLKTLSGKALDKIEDALVGMASLDGAGISPLESVMFMAPTGFHYHEVHEAFRIYKNK